MPTPDCDCVLRGPSYPTYRESLHLPDCVWFYTNRLELSLMAHTEAAAARERRLIARITALENRLDGINVSAPVSDREAQG